MYGEETQPQPRARMRTQIFQPWHGTRANAYFLQGVGCEGAKLIPPQCWEQVVSSVKFPQLNPNHINFLLQSDSTIKKVLNGWDEQFTPSCENHTGEDPFSSISYLLCIHYSSLLQSYWTLTKLMCLSD
jgi:hypothetical protein